MTETQQPPAVRTLESILYKPIRARRPFQHLWMIETEDRKRWIAKAIGDRVQFSWWIKVDSVLRQRGFAAMLPIWTDGKEWILTPYLTGERGCYQKQKHVQQAVHQLARFHVCGRYLPVPPPTSRAAFLLIGRIHRRLVAFAELLRRSHSLKSEEGAFLRRYGPLFYQDGLRVWHQLKRLPILQLIHAEVQQHALAHRDLASHNWLFDPQGNCWLIDFETASYDAQIGDVWQILGRILHEHQWSEQVAAYVLQIYEAVRPLSRLEREILAVLLAYPNDFFREATGWWRGRRGFVTHSVFSFLERLAQERESWRKQVRRCQKLLLSSS